ncbi:UdgX family uracil-DNA binding protein [Kozakia baliensis]|uniref:UdgX family uracil-DNA binding protein n=1 Tax=Kozakia baliensis TaxID=153496 RepID=UPI00087CA351|nr:UdgX family uracil-DNA binding protein [Kozakia baliensis]AOX19636.1 hypothetical protein A0U90_04335 [Kozakia baliensis]
MAEIHLAHAADLKGWRAHVRALLADNTAPSTVAWNIQPPPDLFESNIQPDLPSASIDLKISREHAALISAVIQSSDAERFRLLHQFVYDLYCNRPSDAALEARLSELHEEAQKATIDLRAQFIAAFEQEENNSLFRLSPACPVLAGQAKQLSEIRVEPWMITTPDLSIRWDGNILYYGAGSLHKPHEATYPVKAGQGYWAQLPELIVSSSEDILGAATSIEVERALAADCRRCALWQPANRTVFGEGAHEAALMFVGEQPGDQEDQLGHPFVGPAGQVFNKALAVANIERRSIYLTNAVKHFKFQRRGARRIHQKPDSAEMRACLPWLQAERRIMKPKVIVMLGVTAATSILQRAVTISRERSRPISLEGGAIGIVTVHPSYLLRLPDADARERETRRFEEDLRLAASLLTESQPLFHQAKCFPDASEAVIITT